METTSTALGVLLQFHFYSVLLKVCKCIMSIVWSAATEAYEQPMCAHKASVTEWIAVAWAIAVKLELIRVKRYPHFDSIEASILQIHIHEMKREYWDLRWIAWCVTIITIVGIGRWDNRLDEFSTSFNEVGATYAVSIDCKMLIIFISDGSNQIEIWNSPMFHAQSQALKSFPFLTGFGWDKVLYLFSFANHENKIWQKLKMLRWLVT